MRLYPFLISGLPFSTDGWSCIRNTELLMQNSPVALGNTSLFDGYNNFWPGNSLFGVVFSEATGLAPIYAMAIGVPLAGALTIPLFFVLGRKVTGNVETALIATVLLATAYPYIELTAGVTKETFANPIYLSVILIFLLQPSWKRTLLFSAASSALVLTHHLTAFLTIGILAFLAFALSYSRNNCLGGSLKQNLSLIAILLGITGVYFGFFAFEGLPLALSANDLLAVAAYQMLVFSAVLFFISKNGSISRKFLATRYFIVVGLACSLIILFTQKSLIPTAPTLPLHYFIFFIPYLIIVPLFAVGFSGLHERKSTLLVPVFWLAPLVAFEAYAFFSGSSMGLTLACRILDFLLLPLFVLVGLFFHKFYTSIQRVSMRRVYLVGVAAAVLVAACVGPYSLYSSVSLREPYLGYFWLYHASEVSSADWFAAYSLGQSVAGDMKVFYLLEGYCKVQTDVMDGFRFLETDGSKPDFLFVYPEMFSNGYVIYSGNVAPLSENWSNKLLGLNQVYANNMVTIYAK